MASSLHKFVELAATPAPTPQQETPDQTFMPFFVDLGKILKQIPLSESLRILANAAQQAENVLERQKQQQEGA